MKLAVYIRVSSEEQTKGESLNTQEQMGVEFAKSQGFEYQVFRDEGLSGGEVTRRGGYNDLLKVVRSKQVDVLWVFSTSRLNRDMMNQAVLMYECRKLEIPVYVGNKRYDFANPDDKLQFGFLALMDEYQRNQITRNSVSSKMRLLKEGKWVNGTLPFGYDRAEGNYGLIVSKEEKKILNKILDSIIDGSSLRKVVQMLKLEHEIIGSKVYKYNGQWVRKLLERDYYTSGRISLSIMDATHEFNIEPIVSSSKRERAVSVWKRNQKHRREKPISFLETKLKCEQCKGNITLGIAYGWKRKDGTRDVYHYWSCRNGKEGSHKVRHWSIPKEEIELDVLNYINKFFLNEKFLKDEIKENVIEKYEKKIKELDSASLKKNQKELKKLEGKMEKLKYLFLQNDMTVAEYELQKKECMDNIMVLRRQLEEYDYLEEEKFRLVAEYWLEQISIDNMDAKEFFDSYVEAVYLRVVKREWFKQGRLLKYRFVFKSIGKSGKGKKEQVESEKEEGSNHLLKTTLNTSKVAFDKRFLVYGLMVLVVWDGFEFSVEDVDFGVY